MKVKMNIPTEVNITQIDVNVKVRDNGCYKFIDENDNVVKEIIEDYVPSFFPGDHFGDYLLLKIDIETGQILNWKKPTTKQLEDILNENEEE